MANWFKKKGGFDYTVSESDAATVQKQNCAGLLPMAQIFR